MHRAPLRNAAETLQPSTDHGWADNMCAGGRSDTELSASLAALKNPTEVLSALICSSMVQTFTPAVMHSPALAASPSISCKSQHLQTSVSSCCLLHLHSFSLIGFNLLLFVTFLSFVQF